MVKALKPINKKEKSGDKRKRRENTIKAREQARRFVVPVIVLICALLAAFLVYRFGMGTNLTPEERAKIRTQRQLAKMMREQGTDFSKLREMLVDKKDKAFNVALEQNNETAQAENVQDEESEAIVE